MKKKESPENTRKRSKKFYTKMKEKGLILKKFWIPPEMTEKITQLIKKYCQ